MIDFSKYPARIVPSIVSTELNESLRLIEGPLRLMGPSDGILDSDITLRWLPTLAFEFDGEYDADLGFETLAMRDDEWTLLSQSDPEFKAAISFSSVRTGTETAEVSGHVNSFDLGDGPFDVLRFSLVNFPNYLGRPVNYGEAGSFAGRLSLDSAQGICAVDLIPETAKLQKLAHREHGYVISHVGQWTSLGGQMTAQEAKDICELLTTWFGFLRGAWAGPLFPQGVRGTEVVWRQFAPWKLREPKYVATWLPQRKRLALSGMFERFAELWNSASWRRPLRLAVSWLLEANRYGIAPETRIVLAQISLELLAWAYVVETHKVHSSRNFKRLSASERIRALLDRIGVSSAIPVHLALLPSLCHEDAPDGPGLITYFRNKLTHPTTAGLTATKDLTGPQLYQCAQLVLQYVELSILGICDYTGHYARRGWQGWKGDDEVLVPWSHERESSAP